MTMPARIAWAAVVLGSGWGLAHGLWLSTYFELTEQARIDAGRGERWLWGSTLVLVFAACVARWAWRTPVWSGALLVAAGAISLSSSDADFLPPLVLVAVAPALLLSIGVTIVHRPFRAAAPE